MQKRVTQPSGNTGRLLHSRSWVQSPVALPLLCVISQIHANICAPKGLSGLIYTAISMGSPICQAIIRILSYTSSFYFAIWSAIIVTIISTGWHLMGYLGVRRINTHELTAQYEYGVREKVKCRHSFFFKYGFLSMEF